MNSLDTRILGNVYESASQRAYTESWNARGEEFEFETSSKGKKPEQYTQQVTEQENKNRSGAQRSRKIAQGGQTWASGRDTINGTVWEHSNEEKQQWKEGRAD